MSASDDIDYGDIGSSQEEAWEGGYHIDRHENKILLEDMDTSHIEHTIEYFSGLDTTPLEEELSKRSDRTLT